MKERSLFLPDANIFLNALNRSSIEHTNCRNWLNQATAKNHHLLLNDLTECALLRISTFSQLSISSVELSLAFYRALLDYPLTRRCSPMGKHYQLFVSFINDLNLSGNDINDAWLAALAIEHRATLVSLDKGFARFPGHSWHNPAS